jgi:hypothetical protein
MHQSQSKGGCTVRKPKFPAECRQRAFRTFLQSAAGILLVGLFMTLSGMTVPQTGPSVLFLLAASGTAAAISAAMNR